MGVLKASSSIHHPHGIDSAPGVAFKAGVETVLRVLERSALELTPEYARREYGVAIDVEARRVLPGESAQLRSSMTRS